MADHVEKLRVAQLEQRSRRSRLVRRTRHDELDDLTRSGPEAKLVLRVLSP